jgi:hypothetical protein
METQTKPRKVEIRPDVYPAVEELARNKSMTVQEYADFLFKSITVFDESPSEEEKPFIDVPLTPEQFTKLRAWLDNHHRIEVGTNDANKSVCLVDQNLVWKDKEKVLGGEMLQLSIQVFSPFVDFATQYLSFLGDNATVEELVMECFYDRCRAIHADLTAFVRDATHLVAADSWLKKFPYQLHGEEEETQDC